jgi:hypothetical protein
MTTTTDSTTTTTTTAPASVADAKKAARVTRSKAAPKGEKTPAKGKEAPKAKAPAKATASGKGALYFISANRPASGGLLYAHTEAFLRIYSMHKNGGAPLATARRVMGDTAINYHVSNGRFEKRDGKVYMTESGKIQFSSRLGSIDEEAVKAFMGVMITGKPDGSYVKAAGAITKIA